MIPLIVQPEHLESGTKGYPSENPIALATKTALNTKQRLIHVLVSFDGLLELWNLDFSTLIFSANLGDRATHFFDMWYAGLEPEVPYLVGELPDFLLTKH